MTLPSLYQLVVITTPAGETWQGVVVELAEDHLILQMAHRQRAMIYHDSIAAWHDAAEEA